MDKMRVVMALMVMMMVTVAMMELKITVMMMILWKGCIGDIDSAVLCS